MEAIRPATNIRPGWPVGGVWGILLKTDLKVKHCLRDQSTVKTNAKSQKISTLPAGDSGDQNQYLNQQTVQRSLCVYLTDYVCLPAFSFQSPFHPLSLINGLQSLQKINNLSPFSYLVCFSSIGRSASHLSITLPRFPFIGKVLESFSTSARVFHSQSTLGLLPRFPGLIVCMFTLTFDH
jgi:hypothetical protein